MIEDTLNPDQGICPKCGHVNEATWVFCDKCGERLPWTQTLPDKPGINNLTTEQLNVLFSPPPQPGWSFQPRTAYVVMGITLAMIIVWLFR